MRNTRRPCAGPRSPAQQPDPLPRLTRLSRVWKRSHPVGWSCGPIQPGQPRWPSRRGSVSVASTRPRPRSPAQPTQSRNRTLLMTRRSVEELGPSLDCWMGSPNQSLVMPAFGWRSIVCMQVPRRPLKSRRFSGRRYGNILKLAPITWRPGGASCDPRPVAMR